MPAPIHFFLDSHLLTVESQGGNIPKRSTSKRTYSLWTYRLMRLVLKPLLRLLFRPEVVGREHIPAAGPCFFIANHSTMWDSLFMHYFVTWTPFAGIMTEEFMRGGGLFPTFFRKMGVVTFRKFQPQTAPVREIMRLVHDNRMIVIMPEGESNWDGVTLPTVASTGKLFRALKVPVHPVIIHNSYLAFPRWAYWPRPAKVYVEFRPPVRFATDMTDERVAEMVDGAIQWDPALDEDSYPWKHPWAYRPADGITRLIFRCPHCHQSDGLEEKKGKYLVCRRCDNRWRVGADAYLTHVGTGERRSSTLLFRELCRLPHPVLDFGSQGKGLIRTENLPVSREIEYPHHEQLGRFDCILREDRVDLLPREGQDPITIPIEQIRSVSNELKTKCQLRLDQAMYQMVFERGSSLQWQIYLKGLLPGLDYQLIRPVDYTNYQPPTTHPSSASHNEK